MAIHTQFLPVSRILEFHVSISLMTSVSTCCTFLCLFLLKTMRDVHSVVPCAFLRIATSLHNLSKLSVGELIASLHVGFLDRLVHFPIGQPLVRTGDFLQLRGVRPTSPSSWCLSSFCVSHAVLS